jgi:hypothetical protein
MTISADDLRQLKQAKKLLENPGFAVRVQEALGRPLSAGMRFLPDRFANATHQAIEATLRKALGAAIRTLGTKDVTRTHNLRNKLLATAAGGVGGMFGVAGLTVELPLTTTIMLRSIAEIARSEGEALETPEARVNCLQVLTLGGRSPDDDAAESGYYFVRAVMAKEVSEAIRFVAQRGVAEESAPAIVRFIASVAARFGVVVTEKMAATVIPIVGGASGAVINHLFIDHYQNMARGHFIIRRMERLYGPEAVEEAYRDLKAA